MLNKIFIIISGVCIATAIFIASQYFGADQGNTLLPPKEEQNWGHREKILPPPLKTTRQNATQEIEKSSTLISDPNAHKRQDTPLASIKPNQNTKAISFSIQRKRTKLQSKKQQYTKTTSALSPPYGVHVGSFRNEDNADQLITRLRERDIIDQNGLTAVLDPFFRKNEEGVIRVVIGPFDKFGEAQTLANEFHKRSEFAQVVHFPDRHFLHTQKQATNSRSASKTSVLKDKSEQIKLVPAVRHNTRKTSQDVDYAAIVNGDMLMDLLVDREVVYQAMYCRGKNGSLYIPLSEVALGLEFPISVYPDKGTASGWFLSKERTFKLDINTMSVVSEGKKISLQPETAFIEHDEIYVLLEVFNTFFPLTLIPNYYEMQLHVHADELLPLQIRRRRAAERKLGNGGMKPLKYKLQKLDYDLFSPPRLDARSTISYSSGSENSDDDGPGISFAGNYKGDLLFMSSSVYAQGSINPKNQDKKLMDNFTLLAERVMIDNDYMRKFSLGDITPLDVVTVPSSNRERGVSFTNRDPRRGTDYGVKTFIGTSIPGWEVELYRNGMLVSFQTVGTDGRYNFTAIPLYYGKNEFKLIFYGTEGQQEERDELVIVDGSSIPVGEVIYDTSISQEKLDVWDPQGQSQSKDAGNMRYRGKFSVGITENISVSGALVSETNNNERKNTGVAGVAVGMGNFLTQLDTSATDKESSAVNMKVRGQLADHNIQAEFSRQFGKYQADNPTEDSATLGVTSVVNVDNKPLSYGASISRQNIGSAENKGNLYYTSTAKVGIKLGQTNISNNLNYRVYEIANPKRSNEIFGQLTTSTYLYDIFLRGTASYEFDKESPFNVITASANKRITKETSIKAGFTHDMKNEDLTEIYGQLNWSLGPLTLFNNLKYNGHGEIIASLGFSSSLDIEPHEGDLEIHKQSRVNQGGASARVYLDNDFDGKFSAADEALQGVKIKADQLGKIAITDENGVAYFDNLVPMYATDIELDQGSLKDPRLAAKNGGLAILPRKGKIYDIEVPITLTGEVEGTVVASTSRKLKQRSAVPLELVDENGNTIQKVASSFDGYFFFSNISPGTYSLKVNNDYLNDYDFKYESGNSFIIEQGESTVKYFTVLVGGKDEIFDAQLMAQARNLADTSISPDLLAKLKNENLNLLTKTGASNASAIALKKSQIENTDAKISQASQPMTKTPSDTNQGYSKVVINSFRSQKSLRRAMKFYRLKFFDLLKEGDLEFTRRTNDYLLYIDFRNPIHNYEILEGKLDLTTYDLEQTKILNRIN